MTRAPETHFLAHEIGSIFSSPVKNQPSIREQEMGDCRLLLPDIPGTTRPETLAAEVGTSEDGPLWFPSQLPAVNGRLTTSGMDLCLVDNELRWCSAVSLDKL